MKLNVLDEVEINKGLFFIDIVNRNLVRLNGLVRIVLNEIYKMIVE